MIEFVKDWRGYRVGQVTDVIAGGVADLLFSRGIARPAAGPALGEPAAEPAPESAGDKPAKPGKRNK